MRFSRRAGDSSKVARAGSAATYVQVAMLQVSNSFVRWHCLRQRNASPHEPVIAD
jgi:hypothetical protein